MNQCQFCGHPASLVHVHGHYQCSVCGTNALPCCDADNCDTNMQLTNTVATISNGVANEMITASDLKH